MEEMSYLEYLKQLEKLKDGIPESRVNQPSSLKDQRFNRFASKYRNTPMSKVPNFEARLPAYYPAYSREKPPSLSKFYGKFAMLPSLLNMAMVNTNLSDEEFNPDTIRTNEVVGEHTEGIDPFNSPEYYEWLMRQRR